MTVGKGAPYGMRYNTGRTMAPPTGKQGDTRTSVAPASSERGRPAGTKLQAEKIGE